ncbi:uncharacterized protein B0H64DRAFT_175524 [Chaetomium fimeti]|uniref:Uncharacterized protein n=1 Tax=Chaetomium fimeti TaxID=1854472 RepID=A0AAE0HCD8_9PEZI|nr:hypothetical protein B0H64DRAFT_175524 [Chaetomium fimeti]
MDESKMDGLQPQAVSTELDGDSAMISRPSSVSTQASAPQNLTHSLPATPALAASNPIADSSQPRPVSIAPAVYPATSNASTHPAPGGSPVSFKVALPINFHLFSLACNTIHALQCLYNCLSRPCPDQVAHWLSKHRAAFEQVGHSPSPVTHTKPFTFICRSPLPGL